MHEIEINETTGKASFFAVGTPAWHGLGTVLNAPPTVEEGIKLAGLDWTVKKTPMTAGDIEIPNHVAIIRDSDNKVLGVVGKDYSPLQNVKAFEWFQPFLDSGVAQLEAAGSLFGGRKTWVLAKVTGLAAEVVKNDPVESFILLSNSHDGTSSVKAGYTGVRCVCANTLAMAHNDKTSKLLKVKHKGDVGKTLEKIREIMNVHTQEFQATVEQYRDLAKRPCDVETMKKLVRIVFAPANALPEGVVVTPGEEEDEDRRNLENKILPLFEAGIGMDIEGVGGTLWGAYNAITEFTTHHRGRNEHTRLNSLWFGDSKRINFKALQEASKLARVLVLLLVGDGVYTLQLPCGRLLHPRHSKQC